MECKRTATIAFDKYFFEQLFFIQNGFTVENRHWTLYEGERQEFKGCFCEQDKAAGAILSSFKLNESNEQEFITAILS